MRGDRTPLSPTELSQLYRCEQQLVFDRKHGAKRSKRWQARAGEGRAVHQKLHRQVTLSPRPGSRRALIAGAVVLGLVMVLALIFRLTS